MFIISLLRHFVKYNVLIGTNEKKTLKTSLIITTTIIIIIIYISNYLIVIIQREKKQNNFGYFNCIIKISTSRQTLQQQKNETKVFSLLFFFLNSQYYEFKFIKAQLNGFIKNEKRREKKKQ